MTFADPHFLRPVPFSYYPYQYGSGPGTVSLHSSMPSLVDIVSDPGTAQARMSSRDPTTSSGGEVGPVRVRGDAPEEGEIVEGESVETAPSPTGGVPPGIANVDSSD